MNLTCVVIAFLVATATATPIAQNEDVGEEFVNEDVGEEFVNEDIGEEFVNEDIGEEFISEDIGQEYQSVSGGYAYVKEEDWHLVPDSDGKMHLVDINSLDMEMEPSFIPINDVIFRIWTRQNPNEGQIVQINNAQQLAASNFNAALPTRFHIHGWNGGGNLTGVAVRSALLNQINCNVVVVDWGAGAITLNYVAARNRVPDVGRLVGLYADFLNTQGAAFTLISFIGHSLGAHIAGIAGKSVTRGRAQSVVALDPAGPLFSLDDPGGRVDAGDAVYVESQITDAGRLGFQHPVGHANFYPNWGTSQPGCGNDLTGNCGHGLVSQFYAASINPANHFDATRCRGLQDISNRECIVSGVNRRLGGEPAMDAMSPVGSVFFLTTSGVHPFAHGPRLNVSEF